MTDKQELIERIEDLILANSDDPRKQLAAIATAWIEDRERVETATKHRLLSAVMVTTTDDYNPSKKHRPLEQMWINEVGYEVFKAAQEAGDAAKEDNK